MNAMEALTGYYANYDEDARLVSKHGKVEFLTTVRYIEKYLRPGMKLLEIGAGTGRYSHYYAQKGYAVDAVELIAHNIDVFKRHTRPGETVSIRQGNATDLSELPDDAYDITLLLGPMYHLFTQPEKEAALAEALRVTKRSGVLFVSYCMNEATVMDFCFRKGHIHDERMKKLLDFHTFKTTSDPQEVFELYRKENIDALLSGLRVRRLHFIGTDMYTHYFRAEIDAMDDETFDLYLRYHFVICERADMTGMSHHTLDVLRKD